MKYGAIVIATGIFTKRNRPKPLVADRGITYTEQIVHILLKSGIKDIVVVTGFHRAVIENALEGLPVVCVPCKGDALSVLAGARTGIQQLRQDDERICIYPAGRALVDTDTLFSLMKMREDIVLPYSGRGDSLPYFISLPMAHWLQLYNGKREIEDAMRSLVMIGSATFRKVRIDIQSVIEKPKSNYKSVINWI